MEKLLINEEEAKEMAVNLSDNSYYADQFSSKTFAIFCENLPKPIKASLQSSVFERNNYRSVSLVFADFSKIYIFFDEESEKLFWLTCHQFAEWQLNIIHSYSYQFYKS